MLALVKNQKPLSKISLHLYVEHAHHVELIQEFSNYGELATIM
jgi:hypothetical protein